MRYRLITFAVFGALLVGIGEWNLRNRKIGPLQKLDDLWLEFCVGNSGGRVTQPAVTLIRIDDDYEPIPFGTDAPAATSPEDGSPPQLSRLDFATILAFVGKLDPKSVSFLPTPSFEGKENSLDQSNAPPLKDAALQLPRMTLATVITGEKEGAKKVDFPAIALEGEAPGLPAIAGAAKLPDDQLLANGDPAFTEIADGPGYRVGEELRVPLLAKQGDKTVPSLVLRAVASHLGIPLGEVTADFTGKKPVVRIGEEIEVPVADDGSMKIPDWAGLRRSMISRIRGEDGEFIERHDFATLTVDEIAYTGRQDDELAQRIVEEFRGKFDSVARNHVLVGFDRKADRRFVTAAGQRLSPSQLLARAVATIQSGRHIERWPDWGRWVAVAVIALLAAGLFTLSRGKVLLFGAVAALLFFGACVLVFRSTLTWTPPFAMFALFALLLAVGLILPASGKRVPARDTDDDREESKEIGNQEKA